MFIGLAGTAAASGLAVTIYEWHVRNVLKTSSTHIEITIASNAYLLSFEN